jgi:protein KRI1
LFVPKTNVPVMLKQKISANEATLLAETLQQAIWWYCDTCYKGIQPYETRYDSLESDFTQCKSCAAMNTHEHAMKKFVVPEGCIPPSDDQILKLLEKLILCNECDCKMDDTFRYYSHKTMEDYFLCEDCFGLTTSKKNENMKMKDFSVVEPTRVNVKSVIEQDQFYKLKGQDEELDELIDDYANVDFEDVIAGGIKTRFRYTEVSNENFMLTDDELLYCDDNLLNKYLSLKKIAPYKDQEAA